MQTGAFDDGQWYSLNQRTDSGPETAIAESGASTDADCLPLTP
jgi:hypothetical protein